MRARRIVPASDLPIAELSACVLDGDVYMVGGAWASTAEPEDARLRAEAFVAAADSPGLIADRGTAGWIWGARSRMPDPLCVCVPVSARRKRRFGSHLVVREARLAPADVAAVGPARVTTPARTALDLLRAREWDRQAAETVGALLTLGADPGAVAAALEAEVRRPYGRQALRRLAEVSPR